MKQDTCTRRIIMMMALTAMLTVPWCVWGSSFNAFPPLLKGVRDMAVARDGTLYVLRDAPYPFNQVWTFDRDGGFIDQWGSPPLDARTASSSEINKPVSIAVNSRGRVYIVNVGAGNRWRIAVLDPVPDGYRFTRNIERLGGLQFGKNLRIAVGASDAIIAVTRDDAKGGSAMAIADSEGRVKSFTPYPQLDLVDVITDDTGDIYAVDAREQKIVKFDARGIVVGTVGERLENPAAVAIGERGAIYVIDRDTFNLKRIARGEEIASWGGKGTGPTEFTAPTAMTTGANQVYVADDGTIKVFDASGRFIRRIGGTELLLAPRDLSRGDDGTIYVADAKLGRVGMFDATGNLLSSIGQGVLREPLVVATHARGIFVLDGEALKLFAFFPDGSNVAWNLPETLTKVRIAGMRMTPDGDFALVMERDSFSFTAKIWKVDTRTGTFEEIPKLSNLGRPLIDLSEDGTVFVVSAEGTGIDIYDVAGVRVRGFADTSGENRISLVRPSLVAQGSGDVLYVVDHAGRMSRIRRLDLENVQVTGEWSGWGTSPVLPFGTIVGIAVGSDGSLIVSDAFWGTVLHLVEDGQGRLVPFGTAEFPLSPSITPTHKKKARAEPVAPDIETALDVEAPAEQHSGKMRRIVIAIAAIVVVALIVMRRRRKRV